MTPIARALPDGATWAMTGILWVLARKERRQASANVAAIWQLPAHSPFHRAFLWQVLRHHVVCYSETLRTILLGHAVDVEGLAACHHLRDELLSQGKGLVVVTGHVGNWELCGHLVGKGARAPFTVLAKRQRWRWVSRLIDSVRHRMGTRVLWNDARGLPRQMLQVLHEGEMLGCVMDQKSAGRRGLQVPFFGHSTDFVSGPGQVAAKTGAPMIATYLVRIGPRRYRMLAERIESGAADEMTSSFVRSLERIIRHYPEQWTWSYRRWHEIRPPDRATPSPPKPR